MLHPASLLIIGWVVVDHLCVAQEEYQIECLNQHNYYRKRHQVGALCLDPKLNEKAQKCAEYYVERGKIDHSCPDRDNGEMKIGENLWEAITANPSHVDDPIDSSINAVDLWYNETKDYDFVNGQPLPGIPQNKVGHFTQLVWKESTNLGIYFFSKNSSANVYSVVVALYDPPGNFMDEFKDNVLPFKDSGVSNGGNSSGSVFCKNNTDKSGERGLMTGEINAALLITCSLITFNFFREILQI